MPEFATIRSDLRVLKLELHALLIVMAVLGGTTIWLLVRITARMPGALPGA